MTTLIAIALIAGALALAAALTELERFLQESAEGE